MRSGTSESQRLGARRLDDELQASSQRIVRANLDDPVLADAYTAMLIQLVQADEPIGARACYLATNLQRHLEARQQALEAAPRLEPAIAIIRAQLEHASVLADGLESTLGQLVGVSGAFKWLASRELTRGLEVLRAHLASVRREELELAMRDAWEDLGGEG